MDTVFCFSPVFQSRIGGFKMSGTRVFKELPEVQGLFRESKGQTEIRGVQVPAGVYKLELPLGWERSTIANGQFHELIVAARIVERIEL